jgi:DNA helicase IV
MEGQMTEHPDLAAEQAYIDFAYACLDRTREDAWRLRELTEVGRGGTHQARYEQEVIEEAMRGRLAQLDLHDAALVFGRIDRAAEDGTSNGDRTDGDGTDPYESFHIGRIAVSDEAREPVVVDWRAPVAEPFYRATGREPMGLARRRHFAVEGPRLLAIEDELFGPDHLGVAGEENGLRGHSTLLMALERDRTGQLGDIVATIQAEQDEIIRSPQPGVLVVQGGPGTGKTVVALHRAAYLLYTYRFPLEDQGVLLIGPNRLFLRYIGRVLPSLGEAGVEQVVLADLVPDVRFGGADTGPAAKVKGDARMTAVLEKAVRDRERALRADVAVPFGLTHLRLRIGDSQRIVAAARRRFRRHNAARRFVEGEVYAALAASARDETSADLVRERLRHNDQVREIFERIWPVLTPAQLLHDLFGSPALLRLAGSGRLKDDELASLARPRLSDVVDVRWSEADAPLLDEARAILGPRPGRGNRPSEDEEIRTYGHIVIDEVQDLSPMALRMAARRSLNGSMTVVGDIAQATGQHAPRSWDDVLAHLPDRRPARLTELTVGYRIPAEAMALARRVLRVAAPGLTPPTSVRRGDVPPIVLRAEPGMLGVAVAEAVVSARDAVGGGVAVIAPESLVEGTEAALATAGVPFGQATRQGLDEPVTVVPVRLVKGLELDAVVVVEPARIVAEEPQGLRSLYVALTRATKRLYLVHADPLPEALLG